MSNRFGFTLTGEVAHLCDVLGKPLCFASILYRRESSEGYPICEWCLKVAKRRKDRPPVN